MKITIITLFREMDDNPQVTALPGWISEEARLDLVASLELGEGDRLGFSEQIVSEHTFVVSEEDFEMAFPDDKTHEG